MTLANFDGHNSFTINGKTLTNRASSGATPIYDISSSGGSGSGGGSVVETFDFGDSVYGGNWSSTQNNYLYQILGDESSGKPIDDTKTYYVLAWEGFESMQQRYIFGESSATPGDSEQFIFRNVRVPDLSGNSSTSTPGAHNNSTLGTAPELGNHAAIFTTIDGNDYMTFIYNGKLYCNMGTSTYGFRIHFLVAG